MKNKKMSDKTRTELTELIDEWIFNERGRSVIKRRMLDGITYEKLAEEYNLSVTQIKNICYKCLCTLSLHVVD